MQESDSIPAAQQAEASRQLAQLNLAPTPSVHDSLESIITTLLSDSRLPFVTS